MAARSSTDALTGDVNTKEDPSGSHSPDKDRPNRDVNTEEGPSGRDSPSWDRLNTFSHHKMDAISSTDAWDVNTEEDPSGSHSPEKDRPNTFSHHKMDAISLTDPSFSHHKMATRSSTDALTGDVNTEEDPSGRHSPDKDRPNNIPRRRRISISQPPTIPELRIVLLGRSGEVKSKVGNIILGREVISVEDQCERAQGLVNGRPVTLINTPDLLDPKIPGRKLFYQIASCVTLSAPGPHAFLLVLEKVGFTKSDRKRLKRILGFFSDECFKYSVVLLIQGSKRSYSIGKNPVDNVIEMCRGHLLTLNTDKTVCIQVPELIKKIEQMVETNRGGFLHCETFKEPESAALGAIEGSLMGAEQKMERKQKPHLLPREQQQIEVAGGDRLNLVLFGSTGTGKTSAVNAILGQRASSVDPSPSSVCERREGEVCGRLVTLVVMPADVTHETRHYASLCGPGVHAFLLVTPAGPLTDEDKVEIIKIQEIFGPRVTGYMMVLFTHESPTTQPILDFPQQNKDTQELLNMCGNRFCVFNNRDIVNNPIFPELLKAIEEINRATESCFSLDMFWEAQLEKKDRKIRELEETIKDKSLGAENKDQNSDCIRIVLVGKTGSGKSATGNTILQREGFLSEPSSTSVTNRCKKEVGEVAGRRVAVVDTPGLFDTEVTNEEVQQEMAKCISFLAPGPHVFLIVLQIGRFTKEEMETLQLIKSTFGKNAEMFTIVIFTRGDDLNGSIDSYIQRSNSRIQSLIQDCENRFHVFNNKDKSNCTQVSELLDKIDMMVRKNGGGCYTNEMFQEAEMTIKKECERILREKEEEMQREKEVLKAKHEEEIKEKLKKMKDAEKEKKEIQEDMKKRAEEQLEKVRELEARHKIELEEKDRKIRELEQNIKGTSLAFSHHKMAAICSTDPRDVNTCGRDSPPWDRPNMSDLRIVLLGRSGELKSKVGNIILGRETFETEPSFFLVKQQCERASGLVDGRHVSVINTPDLLHPQISQPEIDKEIESCVCLSHPGPHVILLVLQPERFTETDSERMRRILTTLGDQAFNYTMVLITHEGKKTDDCTDEQRDPIELFIKECRVRFHWFGNIDKTDHAQISTFMESVNRVVTEDEGRYLICEKYKEAESGTHSTPVTGSEQDMERANSKREDQKTQEEKMDISHIPQQRRMSINPPPMMSELRIVLLGRSGALKSKVGNIILGREVLSVEDQCERAEGLVNKRPVALINTPELLDRKLPDRKLFYQIERCVTLSAPGPHALLLVLESSTFTTEDRKRLKRILGFFSDESFKYSVALVTEKSKGVFNIKDPFNLSKSPVHKVVEKCSQRCHTLNNPEEINYTQVTKLMEQIEQMVEKNEGGFLRCEMFKEPELAVLGAIEGSLMGTEQKMERKQKPQAQPREQQQMGKGEKVAGGDRLNLVLFGSSGAGKTSAGNAILGQRESSVDPSPSSVCERREGEVCGRLVTVVEMPALCESQLSASTVSRLCASLCGPGVHAFLLVAPAGPLPNEDKAEITRIQKIFGSRVTDYMMALFTHESPTAQLVLDFLQQNRDTRELLEICSNRFCVFNDQDIVNNPKVLKLLKAIEEMNRATESCFSLEMYWEAQLKGKVRELEARHKMELEEKDRKIRELEENIKSTSLDAENEDQSSDCVRIVLVGKTGSGKSATGNTILQREEFQSLPSPTSVTTCCQKGVGEVAGRRVAVVDTPGLFDTSFSNEEVQEEIAKCISLLAPGPHVFLVVLQIGRITKEEKDTLQLIKSTFGKMAQIFTIVMFTRGDDLNESIDSFIQRGGPTIQYLIQDCGNRFHVFNNKDKSNHTQVSELLDKIDMMMKENGGGCYTNKIFQEAERTIKKECERILREKEEEMQREKEVLMAKHKEEMKKMESRMEEQRLQEENERNRREKELKDKEERLRKECEEWMKRELEEKERRDEKEKKKREKQELEWKGERDKIEKEKSRMKEQWKCKEEEEKKNVERQEKQRQEQIEKQRREKEEFEEKQAIENKKREKEEQERNNREERERRLWKQKIKDAEKEKKEIKEEMKKRAEKWELQRKEEQVRNEEMEMKRKQKEEQERREWDEKEKKMRDDFEKEKKQERQRRENEIRAKEEIERDLEEKKRQLKKQEEEWDNERKEVRERRNKEDEQRREDEKKRLAKLQEEFEREREAENQKRKMEDQARREREEKERKEIEEDHKRKIKEMKRKFEEDARKQAEEFNDFKEKYKREFLALSLDHEKEIIRLTEELQQQALKTELYAFNEKSSKEKIKQLHEKQQKEIDELTAKYERSCVIL